MTSTVTAPPRGTKTERALSLVPSVLLVLLLLLATWFNGGFALRHWAPVALFALVMAAASVWWGGARVGERGGRIAVGALCALALWTVLSALWADSAGRALEGGARTTLYAALFLVALATPAGPRWAVRMGVIVMVGVGAIGALTLVNLLGDGTGQFLAGRLDDPVGYRNATACLFALAFWPFACALAHHGGNPLMRAGAAGAALLLLGLAFLTQSRGVAVGILAGGLVAIALGPDRLRRSWVALIAFGAIALQSDRLLTPYQAFRDGRPESAADIAPAANALLVLVALALALGLAGALLDGGLRVSQAARTRLRRAAAAGLAVLVSLALVATLAATGNPASFAKHRFDEFRSLETSAPGESRLTFGGGQRADLWGVALREFSDRPLTGVGEGNYSFRYYKDRRTDRNLSTPHSLAFSLLAETGLVGALAFVAFLAGILVAVARRWRGTPVEERWAASALLAGGTVVLGQAMFDWTWLIPGVMGLGLICFGLALASLGPAEERTARRTRRGAATAIALALAAAGVGAIYLADVSARGARAGNVTSQERLGAARRAGRLNPWSVTPLYLQASALEELGEPAATRRELLEARDLEPRNFATLGVLGDFELRQGHARAARDWYRRALRLNPLDVGLQKLARGRQ